MFYLTQQGDSLAQHLAGGGGEGEHWPGLFVSCRDPRPVAPVALAKHDWVPVCHQLGGVWSLSPFLPGWRGLIPCSWVDLVTYVEHPILFLARICS